ncbi:hypothetical protein G3435_01080 [Pseudomonas sp. MAFF212428]|uniref:Uncharacterized protein n=1 Tax=Pseudomonas brassicae TaxID=2708063 RepID=A0A6M0CNU4_9PSED|nr:hypothetical protein [Pseudomonas brassicae]
MRFGLISIWRIEMPTARNSGTFQVVLPQVPDALELLADDGGAYLIDRATQDAPLRVLIATSWPVDADDPPGTQSMLQLYWDNATVGAPYVFTWPFDPDQVFPFTAFVPREFLTAPGIHRLKYEVMLWSENEAFSDEILINIDREAPNHNNRGERLGFDDQVIEQGVTDAYLELNRGRLPASCRAGRTFAKAIWSNTLSVSLPTLPTPACCVAVACGWT